jgi:hypothetical protein
MSAWSQRRGGPLDDRQINGIVAYLRSLARRPLLAVSARPSAGDPVAVTTKRYRAPRVPAGIAPLVMVGAALGGAFTTITHRWVTRAGASLFCSFASPSEFRRH